METKWAGKSKTILGLILATITIWAPELGINFTAENASAITESWNEILASVFAAWAAFGRVGANSNLWFFNKPE